MQVSPKKAVILARGLGRRMRAETDGVELTQEQRQIADAGIKALIPVADGRTLLELVIANLTAAGYSEICLVIGPEHNQIVDFCTVRQLDVSFAVQDEAKGTADAVLASRGFVCEEPFAVVNSDNLYPVEGLRRLHDYGRPAMLAFERESLIAKSNISPDRVASFATVEIDENGTLSRIVEKPQTVEFGSFVSMNAWLFPPEIFDACRAISPSERGEYEITAAVQYAIDALGLEIAALKTYDGVFDLSDRTDIKTVGSALSALYR